MSPPPDYAWDYNWNDDITGYTPHEDNPDNENYNTGGNNTEFGGNPGTGNGGNQQTESKIILTQKVKPGQTHTQAIKVLRDPNTSASTKVIDLIVNGAKVGTVTLSSPQKDSNGVHIYSKITVEVFSNSPVAITNVTFENPETSKFMDSQNSKNGNFQEISGDMKLYPNLGIIVFDVPINENEDMIISGSTTAATDDPGNKKDPCVVAKQLSAFTSDPAYKKAIHDINDLPNGIEYSIALGKNSTNQIIAGTMSIGNKSSVKIDHTIQGYFLDFHNHPSHTIHSGLDLYYITLVDKLYPNYIGGIVLPNKEEVYAAVVTDLAAAQAFVAKYLTDPKTNKATHYPEFMHTEMIKIWAKMNSLSIETQSRAKAFVLSKYNSGFSLLRQGLDGKFYPLTIKQTKHANGSFIYNLIPCI